MPGAYTHLTIVTRLSSPNSLSKTDGLSRPQLAPLLRNIKFIELGAVSPDYPYLHLLSSESKAWADIMHYEKTGERLRRGVQYVSGLQGEEQAKALAWLLGFTSHVITDVTIHPVVERMVGPYAQNQNAHRTCEMHQDVYIFQRLQVGQILSDDFLSTGIATCTDPQDADNLDPAIRGVWSFMLQETAPEQYKRAVPNFSAWHKGFKGTLSLAAPGSFFAFSRHLLGEVGLIYPGKPDMKYIQNIPTPDGTLVSYDAVFEKAEANVRTFWGKILRTCLNGREDLSGISDWNLDTGRDESQKITFWEA